MWLIVGLGNPGVKYSRTRHNIGFDTVDELLQRNGQGSGFQHKFGSDLATAFISAHGSMEKCIFAKPMEYMNNSGFSVARILSFFRIEIDQVIVIHDDIDLDAGRLKLKNGGGHGGHNGLRSIIAQCGSNDFMRVRMGVGAPENRSHNPVADYVLSKFSTEEGRVVEEMVDQAMKATEMIVIKGLKEAMNQFN